MAEERLLREKSFDPKTKKTGPAHGQQNLGGAQTHWHLRHITQHSRPHTRAAAAEGVLLWPSSALPSLHLHAPVDTQAKNKTLAAAVAHPKKEKEEEDDFDSWPPLRQTGSSTIDPIRASTTHTQMLLLLLLYIQTQDTERETNDDDSW